MKIPEDVLAVLSDMTCDGGAAKITSGQLDRGLYLRTNKVLEALGGTWDRKTKVHRFANGDAAERLDAAIVRGEVTHARSELGFFPTPPAVAREVIAAAELRPGVRVLEPSAGDGALAVAARAAGATVDCIDINPTRILTLVAHGFAHVEMADFRARDPAAHPRAPYDRVVMNPPFSKQQDVAHVTHAFGFLKPGTGRLVAVMSAGVAFRQDKRTRAFRELVAMHHGSIEDLPEGAFKVSGTGVRTVLVTMVAPDQ